MATVKDLMVKIKADTSDFDRGMDDASNSASSFSSKMGNVMENVKSFLIYDIGKNLVTGFVNATKSGIEYNATLEQSAIKWETLLGTQEKANKMLQDIEKFAADTPFEKMGVEAMATQLHNAGFEGEALFNQISKFGDLAGAFGIQSDSLQEMVRQYSQVKQAGVAYTEDLNILQDRGIPIYKALAKELGINTADVKKWASEGKISSDVYQSALDSLAKGVEGGMAKMSKSFSGQLSTMKDNFEQMAGTLSKPIFDFLADQLSKIMPFIESVASSLSENGLMGTIQRFAPGIMPYIESAIGIFDNLKNSVKRILDAITGFWDEHSSWLMPLITFVWDFICNVISNTINAIASVIEAGLGVIDGIINFFQNLFSGNFSACWDSIKQIFSNAITLIWNWMQVQFAVNLPSMIKNFGKNFMQWIDDAWISVKDFFKNGASNIVTSAKEGFRKVLQSVIDKMKEVPTNVKSFLDDAVNKIKEVDLYQIGKDMIQGLINGIKNMGSDVIGAVSGVVRSAINAAKEKLGIKSPSRVFKQIGNDTGEGLINGIKEKQKYVSDVTRGLSNSAIDGYNTQVKNLVQSKINANISKSSTDNNCLSKDTIAIIEALDKAITTIANIKHDVYLDKRELIGGIIGDLETEMGRRLKTHMRWNGVR